MIKLDKALLEQFADFKAGVISCSQINNRKPASDIALMLRDIEEFVKVNFSRTKQTEQLPHFHTVERLLMEVLKGKEIQSKDKLTNLCNFISLKHLVPVGIFDVKSDGAFTLTSGNGELVLRDTSRVYDNAASKSTQHALVLVEALPSTDVTKLEGIVEELATLIKIFCGGKIRKGVLSKDQVEIPFS